MWIEKRGKQSAEGVIDIKTVKRDEQHWRKYYADNKLITIPIKKVTTRMLNDFLNDSITTFKFSRKEFNNMKTILNAVYRIAMDKEILSVNPLLNTHTDVKFRSIQRKKDGSKLYLENEMELEISHNAPPKAAGRKRTSACGPPSSFSRMLGLYEIESDLVVEYEKWTLLSKSPFFIFKRETGFEP